MNNILKKLKDILPAKDKGKLILLFLLMFLGGALEVLSIGVIAGFVAVVANPDILLDIEPLRKILSFLNIESSQDILVYGSITLIVVFILKNSYLAFYKYAKARFIYNRYKSISRRLFVIYMNVPYSFHLRKNSADLVRNVTTESKALATNLMLPLLEIATETVMALGIIILLLVIEPVITIVTLLLLGGISALFLKITKNRMRYYGEKALKERGKIIKTVNEGVGGLKDAKVMNRQNWFVEKFEESIDSLAKANIFHQATKASVRPVVETIAIVGMLVIALVLLNRGYSIGALASTLALFTLSLQRILPAIKKIISEYSSLRYHSYSINPIHEDLISHKKYENEKRQKEIQKMPLKEKIEIENVSFIYPETKEKVINNVSFSIKKGSAVGFVGSTGSGKTTLVDIILGLLEPTQGKVLVDKKDIKEDTDSWQENIGYIPQFIYLSDDTIKNNIAFGLNEDKIDEEKIEKAVKAAHLEEFIKTLPQGIDTFIGERGVRLSGGQKQRIGIARALYNNPEVLVMDEATSSLDNITEKFVIKAIEELKEDRTVIIIAHRLTTVKNCDTLYLIKNGKIEAQGSYTELLKNSDFKKMNEGS